MIEVLVAVKEITAAGGVAVRTGVFVRIIVGRGVNVGCGRRVGVGRGVERGGVAVGRMTIVGVGVAVLEPVGGRPAVPVGNAVSIGVAVTVDVISPDGGMTAGGLALPSATITVGVGGKAVRKSAFMLK